MKRSYVTFLRRQRRKSDKNVLSPSELCQCFMHEAESKLVTLKHAVMELDLWSEVYREKRGLVGSRCSGGKSLLRVSEV